MCANLETERRKMDAQGLGRGKWGVSEVKQGLHLRRKILWMDHGDVPDPAELTLSA